MGNSLSKKQKIALFKKIRNVPDVYGEKNEKEAWERIFLFLPIEEICNMTLTCKKFQRVIETSDFFCKVFNRYFPASVLRKKSRPKTPEPMIDNSNTQIISSKPCNRNLALVNQRTYNFYVSKKYGNWQNPWKERIKEFFWGEEWKNRYWRKFNLFGCKSIQAGNNYVVVKSSNLISNKVIQKNLFLPITLKFVGITKSLNLFKNMLACYSEFSNNNELKYHIPFFLAPEYKSHFQEMQKFLNLQNTEKKKFGSSKFKKYRKTRIIESKIHSNSATKSINKLTVLSEEGADAGKKYKPNMFNYSTNYVKDENAVEVSRNLGKSFNVRLGNNKKYSKIKKIQILKNKPKVKSKSPKIAPGSKLFSKLSTEETEKLEKESTKIFNFKVLPSYLDFQKLYYKDYEAYLKQITKSEIYGKKMKIFENYPFGIFLVFDLSSLLSFSKLKDILKLMKPLEHKFILLGILEKYSDDEDKMDSSDDDSSDDDSDDENINESLKFSKRTNEREVKLTDIIHFIQDNPEFDINYFEIITVCTSTENQEQSELTFKSLSEDNKIESLEEFKRDVTQIESLFEIMLKKIMDKFLHEKNKKFVDYTKANQVKLGY